MSLRDGPKSQTDGLTDRQSQTNKQTDSPACLTCINNICLTCLHSSDIYYIIQVRQTGKSDRQSLNVTMLQNHQMISTISIEDMFSCSRGRTIFLLQLLSSDSSKSINSGPLASGVALYHNLMSCCIHFPCDLTQIMLLEFAKR